MLSVVSRAFGPLNYSFIILSSSLPQIRQINIDAEVQKRERLDIERKVQSQNTECRLVPYVG